MKFKIKNSDYSKLPDIVKRYFPENNFSFSYLLTENSVKTKKGEKKGVLTGVLYLAPSTISGTNYCSSSVKECRPITGACLWSSGQLGLPNGRCATIARSIFLNHYPSKFISQLLREVAKLERKAQNKNMVCAVRLNGTSDLPWESGKYQGILNLMMSIFPNVVFYDYTKHIGRCVNGYRQKHGIRRYKLCFSYSGSNWKACQAALKDKVNVAVCFAVKRGEELPKKYKGYTVVDGDLDDLIFLGKQGVIRGLRYKLPKQLEGKGTDKADQFPNFVVDPT